MLVLLALSLFLYFYICLMALILVPFNRLFDDIRFLVRVPVIALVVGLWPLAFLVLAVLFVYYGIVELSRS